MSVAQSKKDTSSRKEEGDQSISLYEYPEKLRERIAMSCSLIDETHHATWGEGGIIIEAPQDTIVITSSSDAGAIVMDKELLLQQAKSHRRYTPDELLASTDSLSHNEVVIVPKHNNKAVVLKGFFYKVTEEGVPINESIFSQMRSHASRMKLPLVPVKEKNQYSNNQLIRDTFGNIRTVFFKEKSFRLVPYNDGTGQFYNESYGRGFFSSPKEMEEVFGFLQTQNISRDIIEKLKKEYELQNKKHFLPIIHYDSGGKITSLIVKEGYRKEETRVCILRYEARQTNTYVEAEKFMRNMASGRMRRIELREIDKGVLSAEQTDRIIEGVLIHVTHDQSIKIKAWYQSIRDQIDSNWKKVSQRNTQFSRNSLNELFLFKENFGDAMKRTTTHPTDS